jgi:hypothetical protein
MDRGTGSVTMAGGWKITIDAVGLPELAKFLEVMPEVSKTSARIAFNDVGSGEGLALFRDSVNEQVNFPAGYLNPGRERLYLKRRALNERLEIIIAGRDRPTSLARFLMSWSRQSGAKIKVKRSGRVSTIGRAFQVRLRAGATLTNDNFNVGLALRVEPGQGVRGKIAQATAKLAENVYLLYGPSVGQVFDDVATEETPAFVEMVSTEFLRQFNRLAGK